jgi:hypothetical protein
LSQTTLAWASVVMTPSPMERRVDVDGQEVVPISDLLMGGL